MAHFQSKKELAALNSNPSVLKCSASVIKYSALHSLSKAVVFTFRYQHFSTVNPQRSVSPYVEQLLFHIVSDYIKKKNKFNSVINTEGRPWGMGERDTERERDRERQRERERERDSCNDGEILFLLGAA